MVFFEVPQIAELPDYAAFRADPVQREGKDKMAGPSSCEMGSSWLETVRESLPPPPTVTDKTNGTSGEESEGRGFGAGVPSAYFRL